jgi:hypothetical protein
MWCLTLVKPNAATASESKTQMANDFEVYRYYDLKTHIKDGQYVKNIPTMYHNGLLKNEFQIKTEQYLFLDEFSKNKIRIKVKHRLPKLEKKYKQIRMNQ